MLLDPVKEGLEEHSAEEDAFPPVIYPREPYGKIDEKTWKMRRLKIMLLGVLLAVFTGVLATSGPSFSYPGWPLCYMGLLALLMCLLALFIVAT
ncbi:MAG: hypothetical protein RDV48_17305 [Candidatus Eremiobacteraeota bacterium]|nr:hypothetical protein [Candidatus Eremiobacteraeota bacterium]